MVGFAGRRPLMAGGLSAAFTLAESWVRDGIVPGVSVAIMQGGEFAGEFTGGKRSAGGGGPVQPSTLYSIASMTKPYTAAAFMRLVDRGLVGLDESVRRVVPGFSSTEKREITFRMLLSHLSGMPKDDPAENQHWQDQATSSAIAASAAMLPLEQPPGQRVLYSNAAYWLIGEALAALTDRAFPDALREEILDPCGLAETFISAPPDVWDRIARRYGRAKIMNAAYGRELGSPSAGLFASARDAARFADLFLRRGITRDGRRILSAASVEMMTTDQTGGLPGGIDGLWTWPAGSWGLGWEVKGNKLGHWSGELTSPATFSHFGQGGTLVWADPATGIACAVLANRDVSTGWTADPARWARLSNAVVAALT
jgi:CubicO group peptidase (beta-lactamase class C family)